LGQASSIKGFFLKDKKGPQFPFPLLKAINSTYLKILKKKKEIREHPMGGSPS
jgi:hypothetical protein